MGMGLQAAYGADALQQNLRQRIMDQIAAQQRERDYTQRQFENDLQTKQFNSNEELKRAQLQATAQERHDRGLEQDAARAGTVAEQIPAGTEISGSSPLVGTLRLGGRESLLTPKASTVEAPPDALAAIPAQGDQPMPGTIANAPSPTLGRSYIKGATQKQAEATISDTAKQNDAVRRQSESEARIQKLSDDVNVAWERLRSQGENNATRAALASKAAELAQAKLEATQQHNTDVASKTPQPQFFNDANGKTHAVIFDKGTFKEVPLPAGYTPTKAAAPSLFDKIKGLFGSSEMTPDPTDPNWGK